LLVLGPCLTFGVILVGHGLPFWPAAAFFVTASIVGLQYQRDPLARIERSLVHQGRGDRSRAGIVITIVFRKSSWFACPNSPVSSCWRVYPSLAAYLSILNVIPCLWARGALLGIAVGYLPDCQRRFASRC
jgi:hypothetical protein